MKKFLFVTHLTPKHKRSKLREDLYEISLSSIKNQEYKNWKVFIVGEEELETENLKQVKIDYITGQETPNKQLEIIFDRKDVKDFFQDSDFIIKLDDDDVISPYTLEKIHTREFDVYYDDYHTFFDVTSGQITQQKRSWIASTCIHKTEHALSPVNSERRNYFINSLLYTDHSKAWHQYYKNKIKLTAPKENPVYLRILSPTSISSGAKVFPAIGLRDIDLNQYYSYLKSFGYWLPSATKDFSTYLAQLNKTWFNFSGIPLKKIPHTGIIRKIIDKALHYGKRP